MAAIALDSDVVIAFLDEGDAQHERAVDALLPHFGAGDVFLVSASVYAEVMIRPLQTGVAGTVDDFLDAIRAEVVAIDRSLARRAAELRARHRSLRLPDALSVAAAVGRGAQLLTLDRRLRRIATAEAGG